MPTEIELKFETLLRQHENPQDKEKLCEAWIRFFFLAKSVATPEMLDETKCFINELLKETTGHQYPPTSLQFLALIATEENFFYLCYLSTYHENLPQAIQDILKKKLIDKTVFFQRCETFLMSLESAAPEETSNMIEIITIYIHEIMQENQTPIPSLRSIDLIHKMIQEEKLHELFMLLCLQRNQLNHEILISSAGLLLNEFKRSSYRISFLFQLMQYTISIPANKKLSSSVRELITHINFKIEKKQLRLSTPFPLLPNALLQAISQLPASTRSESHKSLLHDFGQMLIKHAIVSHSVNHVSAYYLPWINVFFAQTHIEFFALAHQALSSNPLPKNIVELLFSAQLKLAMKSSISRLILSLFTVGNHAYAWMLEKPSLSHKEMEHLSKLLLSCIQDHKENQLKCEESRVVFSQNLSAQMSSESVIRSIQREIEQLRKASDLIFLMMFSQIREQKAKMRVEDLPRLIRDHLSIPIYAVTLKYQLQDQLPIPLVTENSNAFFDTYFLKGFLPIIQTQDKVTLSTLFSLIGQRKNVEDFITWISSRLSTEDIDVLTTGLIQANIKHSDFIISKIAFMTNDPDLLNKVSLCYLEQQLNNCLIILKRPCPSPTTQKMFDFMFLGLYVRTRKNIDTFHNLFDDYIELNIHHSKQAYFEYLRDDVLKPLPETPFKQTCLERLEAEIRSIHILAILAPTPGLLSGSRGSMFQPHPIQRGHALSQQAPAKP